MQKKLWLAKIQTRPLLPKGVKAIFAAAAGIVFLSGPLSGGAEPLSEDAAVRMALERNPMVFMFQARSGMGWADYRMARSERLPAFSLNGISADSSMPASILSPGAMPQSILWVPGEKANDLNGMLMVPLFTGGRLKGTQQEARWEAKAREEEWRWARVEAAYMTRVMMAEWREAIAMEEAAAVALKAQEENEANAEAMFEVGKIPKFDLLSQKAETAAARQALADAAASVAVARARLAEAMGGWDDRFTEPGEESAGVEIKDPGKAALESRPDVKAARLRLEGTNERLKAARGEYLPQVYAYGMADVFEPDAMGETDGYSVGVAASLPMLDGGRRRAGVEAARQAGLEAAAAVKATELRAEAEAATARARLEAARKNLTLADARVEATEESYLAAQARYASGKSAVIELLEALRMRTEAQSGRAAARARERWAWAELMRAAGLEM